MTPTQGEYDRVIEILTQLRDALMNDIMAELRKANNRPLYIVVNSQEAMEQFARMLRGQQPYEGPGLSPFTYGERWWEEQVRYEVHDKFGRAWIDGHLSLDPDWHATWDRLFWNEEDAQAEVKRLNEEMK